MKSKYYLLGLPLVALIATACGNGSASKQGEMSDDINEFTVGQKFFYADKNYRVDTDYGTVYLQMSTSVQWPDELGAYDIAALQESLIKKAYRDSASTTVKEAIQKYIEDTSIVDGAKDVVAVDSLPVDSMTYFSNVTANVLDLDEAMVTYQIVGSTFLGGAHPMTGVRPFTYDFAEGKVLDSSNIFLPDVTNDSVMPIITEALARQLGVPVSSLEDAGIFVSQLTYPGRPYITNNVLYFHYDPYEVGPYSLGNVDVAVYPYEIERFLDPAVKKLFNPEL
ncbi:MAG: RsiV family protein [Duncaniella sp.]|nr:RsiV family protein [Duncaniella sp.]MDE6824967.1 RsiV family protein [Duncaniella sp.]